MTRAEDGSSLICAQILFCTEPASSSKSPGSIKAFVIVLSNVCHPPPPLIMVCDGNLLTGKRGYKLGLDTILAKFHSTLNLNTGGADPL